MLKRVSTILLLTALVAAGAASAQSRGAAAAATTTGKVRGVTYHDSKLEDVWLREGFTTMIALPPGEGVVEMAGGGGMTADEPPVPVWPIDWKAGHHVFYVRAAIEGLETNVHVTAQSGTVYSFMLHERKNMQPDARVHVLNPALVAKPALPQRFFTAEEVAQIKDAAVFDVVRATEAQQNAAIAKAVEEVRAQYPLQLHPYEVSSVKPFLITGMYHDGRFTYAKTTAREIPILYEMKDGKPSAVTFQVRQGHTYVIPKVLEDTGFWQLGAKRIPFKLVQEN